MGFRFNPPPGWQVAQGFNPKPGWVPDPAWPPAPEGWQFWVPDAATTPPPPTAGAWPAGSASQPPASAATKKVGGWLNSLKAKAEQEDWTGKAKTAANQAVTAAQQMTAQASTAAKQRDRTTVENAGPMPPGALWRGVSHEAGRNSIVTLYPDRLERTKPASKMSLTGLLTPGSEEVEIIPTKSISSVQAKRGSWYHDVTVYASGNTIVLSLDAADAERLRALILDQVLGASSRAPSQGTPAASSGDVLIEQIRKLGELRDAGIITNEEFESKKAEMLGRL